MRNQRLADAIRQSGLGIDGLAEKVGVDPKTARRWVTLGRVPHRTTRARVASVLGVSSAVLWPEVAGEVGSTAEVLGLYTTRADVSPATIGGLLAASHQQIDILAYSALYLWDSVRGFVEELIAKADDGVGIRVCLGDPDCDAVALRGREEGIGEEVAGRCRLAARYAMPLVRAHPGMVRVTDTTLYATLARFDDEMLLNTHLWGNPAAASPVLHLRCQDDFGVFNNAVRSFERVWEAAQPLAAG